MLLQRFALFIFLSASFALAIAVKEVPEKLGGTTYGEPDLKVTTVIQHRHFSFMVPKGWSYVAKGEGDQFYGSLETSPMDYETNKSVDTFITVSASKVAPALSLEERYQKWKLEKREMNPTLKNLNGTNWMLCEFEKEGKKRWYGVSTFAGKDYQMFAEIPVEKVAEHARQLRSVIDSIKIY